MNRPFTIGTLFGSDLRLHWSWLVFPVGVAGYSLAVGTWQSAVFDLLLLLLVYFSVLLHEGVQFLAARHYGLGTRDVTLYAFWGVARPRRMSERPWQETCVAVTGPIVWAILAAAVGAGLSLAGSGISFPKQGFEPTTEVFFIRLFWAMVLLTLLHLLPLLPLDGGRILRAWLAMRMSRLRATEVTALISTLGAIGLVVIAVFWLRSPLLGTTAAFVFLAAQEELGTTRFFDRIRCSDSERDPSALVPLDQIVTPDCRPDEPGFTGFTWNADARLWIEWHEGQPVAANALIGDGRP